MTIKKSYFVYSGIIVSAVIIALSVTISTSYVTSQNASDTITVKGGGYSILVGGDGGMIQENPELPTPIITKFAIYASKTSDGVDGFFECLALAPNNPKSFESGSGDFTTNIMYVTGTVNDIKINNGTFTLDGKATVTGVGEGIDLGFSLVTAQGGPGTFMTLTIQYPESEPLIFNEIVTEGRISLDATQQ